MRSTTRAPLICVAMAVTACGSDASEPRTGPGCTDCVEFEVVAELDFGDAPTLPGPNGLLVQGAGGGRWAFVDRSVPSEVLVFESDGSFSEVVGGEGSGPGEFREIEDLFFDSFDSLWVVSRGGRRADLYDSTLEQVRGMALEARVVRAVPMARGRILAVTSDEGRPVLAWISRDGSFQPVRRPSISTGPPQLVPLASDGADRFWIAEPHAYRVWEGGIDGEVALLVEEPPAWFEEEYGDDVVEEFGDFIDTRGATILALSPGPGGAAIWLIAGVPSSSLDALQLRRVLESQDRAVVQDLPALLLDHVVQGVSTGSGVPRARGRFDYIGLSPGATTLYDVRDDTVLRVLRPSSRALRRGVQ